MNKSFAISVLTLMSSVLLTECTCNPIDVIESVENKIYKNDIHGIDISHHQGTVNWNHVADDTMKIRFVFIKSTEGATHKDSRFKYNVTNAYKSGIKTGAYHFFRMTSSPERQFANFKRTIEPYMEHITLLPVLDVETFDGKTQKQVKTAVEKFVRLVHDEWGVYPIIYGPDIAPSRMMSGYVNKNCLFWLGYQPGHIKRPKHDIHQYTCHGTVKGIKGGVDINRLHNNITLDTIKWNR